MELPHFRYHPDPLATGSIKESDAICPCCGEARGFAYSGTFYSTEDVSNLCPWCIASGAAIKKFGGSFIDAGLEGLPAEVVNEVSAHTPAFSSWQDSQWWQHCGDAGAFVGYSGEVELSHSQIEELIEELQTSGYGLSANEWREYFREVQPNSSLAVYVFRCLHCGRTGGYADSD